MKSKFKIGDSVVLHSFPESFDNFMELHIGGVGVVVEDSTVPFVRWENNTHSNGEWAVEEDSMSFNED